MIEGDDSLKPVSNFTKMIRKFNLDENLIRNIQVSGYKRPTPIQMIGIPAMFKVFERNMYLLIIFIEKKSHSSCTYREW